MFWGDRIIKNIESSLKKKIESGESLIIRDEKTASGRVHIGSLRSVAVHGIVDELLSEKKIPHKFFYEINDFDPMDGLPVYLNQDEFTPFLGHSLHKIPSPDKKAKNYAEYFGDEFKGVIAEAQFKPEYYRATDLYLSGKMNGVIKEALENAEVIRKIFKDISGSEKKEGWLPINILCENCGKISTTKVTDFDGETVAYTCYDLEWTKGCGKSGRISPFDGHAKFTWKVDWAAKWKVMNVAIEGGGKDHSTKGGARDVANHVSREVFKYEPPFDVPYEFFLVGGKKMSSSKGAGSSAREIADLLPPQILRLVLIQKDITQAINFDPAGDTIPVLFDTYDKIAEVYWSGTKDDQSRLFELCNRGPLEKRLEKHFLLRFSQVVFITQMPHLDLENEAARIKGSVLSDLDKEVLNERKAYAERWLSTYASDEFKYELQKTVPEVARHFRNTQKEALKKILNILETGEAGNGETLHTKLHDIRKESGLDAKVFFSTIYLSFLGKESGPKAGWFLSVLDKDFLIKRLKEVTQ